MTLGAADHPAAFGGYDPAFTQASVPRPAAKQVPLIGMLLVAALAVGIAVVGVVMLGVVMVGVWWLLSHIPLPPSLLHVLAGRLPA